MKRTPLQRKSELKRTPLARVAPIKPGPLANLKSRKCKANGCAKEYVSAQTFVTWCSPECGSVIAMAKLAKRKDAAAKADRKATRERLKGFITIPKLKGRVQKVFNEYCRLRDQLAGYGCICCGKFATAAALAQPGGAYDACHYRSRGSADHLRFDERNVHLGLKDCNTWGHKDYRGGLIKRIGLAEVEALEADQTVIKWTRELLLSIEATYKQKIKELKARANAAATVSALYHIPREE